MENLKTFEQLTDKELLDLTQDQIDWYIKLKKAEAGIKIILCPAVPEYREVVKPDVVLYTVAGFNFTGRETAEEIAKFINARMEKAMDITYNWSRGDSNTQYTRPYTGSLADVSMKSVYSELTYNSIAEILTSNGKIEKSYKDSKREYDEENNKATELVDGIYETIQAARTRSELFAQYLIRIQEYLRLSNGDTAIAWNFFDKAYVIDPSVKNKILENEEYIMAVEGYK